MRRIITVQIIGFLIAGLPSAWAGEPDSQTAAGGAALGQGPVRLSELIQEALVHHPGLEAAKARWESAKAKISQAWALKNPWVSYDWMGSELQTRTGPQEARYGISQEIPFPAKLPLRSREAQLAAMRAEHEVLHAQQHIRSQVTAAYAELYWAQRVLDVLQRERGILEQVAAAVEAKYATGEGRLSEAAKVEAELARLAERVLMVKNRRVAAEERLSVLVGRHPAGAWVAVEDPVVPVLSLSLEELLQMALRHRHRLTIARLMDQQRQVAVQLSQMEYLPDMEVGFMVTEIGGGTTTRPDDGEDAWIIPLRFRLPLWEPQIRGGVRAAEAEKEASEKDVRNQENMARAEVIERHTQYETAQERREVYSATWLPQAEQALASAQAAYRSGQGSLLEVLDSERMRLEAELGYLRSLADALSAHAGLEQAVGIPLETAAPGSAEISADEGGVR